MDKLINLGPYFIMLLPLIIVWTLVWKGLALWKSARNGNKAWFVILLIVNTMGILEILYLYVFGKEKKVVGID